MLVWPERPMKAGAVASPQLVEQGLSSSSSTRAGQVFGQMVEPGPQPAQMADPGTPNFFCGEDFNPFLLWSRGRLLTPNRAVESRDQKVLKV